MSANPRRNTTGRRGLDFWGLQVPGWFLVLWLIYAQGISAFGYELGISMGTQEPPERITEVGAAFWYGFAFGDLIIYIPLIIAGLIGQLRGARWGLVALAAALGITVYWPIVCLAALVDARNAQGWEIASEAPYWAVCLLVACWGAVGLWLLLRQPPKLFQHSGRLRICQARSGRDVDDRAGDADEASRS